MGFWLKKVVEFWLMPVPMCLVLLGSAWWLLRRASGAVRARVLIGAAFVILLAGSNILISSLLVAPLEREYPPVPELPDNAPPPRALAGCRYVVVLGAGHGDAEELPALAKLSYPGIERLVEAVRLLRHLPGATLVVSGPAAGRGATHASVLAAAAEALGVTGDRIRQITTARDTEEEAAAVAALARGARVALVTSAVHLPRAAALFRRAGIDFVPCPADYTAKLPARWGWSELRCDTESIDRTTTFVRERLGLLWLRLRGKA